MINISNPDIFIGASNNFWLDQQEQLSGSNLAVISSSGKLTYAELSKSVNSVCSFLKKLGIKENDNAAVLSENTLEFMLLIFALWKLNAVPVPLNIKLTGNELKRNIEFSDAKIVLIHHKLFPSFKDLPNAAEFKFVFKQKRKTENLQSTFNANNNALIMFTSGSSGKPKAVVHTFRSLFYSAEAADSIINLKTGDKFLASLPFYHIGGVMIFVRTLLTGSTVVLPESFSSDYLLKAIDKYEVNYISIVGKTLKDFLEKRSYAPKSLKYILVGGGPVDRNLSIEAVKRSWHIIKVYGSTETCSMTAAILPEEILNKPSSSGRPLLGNSFSIKKFPHESKLGEVVIRSRYLFKEYYKNKKITDEKLRDGYFYTGDIGYLDDDGYIYIQAKREDLIVTGGENVDPTEVKNAIEKFKGVKESYVFGTENKEWGQIVCAAVIAEENFSIDKEELKTFLKKSIAGYKIPKKFLFLKELPRTELGKVMKNELIKRINN